MNAGLISVDDVARQLGVPVSWVYNMAEKGQLPSFKIGKYRRFSPEEIAEWLQRNRAAGKPTAKRMGIVK